MQKAIDIVEVTQGYQNLLSMIKIQRVPLDIHDRLPPPALFTTRKKICTFYCAILYDPSS